MRFKNKALAAALATAGGTLGAHRFYLYGRRDARAWVYALWTLVVGTVALTVLFRQHPDLFDEPRQLLHPLLFLALLPALLAFGESLYLALTPDARWDERHNPGLAARSHSGGWAALVAVFTLAIALTVVLSMLAISVTIYFTSALG